MPVSIALPKLSPRSFKALSRTRGCCLFLLHLLEPPLPQGQPHWNWWEVVWGRGFATLVMKMADVDNFLWYLGLLPMPDWTLI